MKVKIIKSNSIYYWYANKIGEVFKVEKELYEDRDYIVKEKYGERYIGTDDCIIYKGKTNWKLILSTITAIVGYTLLCTVIFYYVAIPKIIENRAKDLNLMRYNGEKDTFVAKDSLNISGCDLYYLQHGNMNAY